MLEWMAARRKDAGLTQRQLAANLGVVHSLVGKVEQGERRLDPLELAAYCRGMRADPCELLKLIQRDLAKKKKRKKKKVRWP